MRTQWEEWMAEEDAHFASDRARDRANIVVDGAPSIPHDPEEALIANVCSGPTPPASKRLL
jgi:hypothetical protein